MEIAIIIFLGNFLISFKKPTFGLGLILALLPTYLIRFSVAGIPVTLLEILVVSFSLAIFVFHYKNLAELKKLKTLNWVILLFVLAAVTSTIYSPEPLKALGQLKAFFIEPVLFFYTILLTIRKSEDLNLPLKFLFGSASAISAFGIFQYFTFLHLPLRFWGFGEEMRRITSVFEYPNALALFLAPIFIFFLVLITDKNSNFKINKFWANFGLVLIAAALFLTFSRGAWLAVLLALFVYLGKKLTYKYAAIGLLIILLVATAAVPSVRHRFNFTDHSSEARGDLMLIGVKKITQSPILGNGLYGFRTTLEQTGFKGEILNYPHNIILNLWLEVGIVGLLAFFMIILVSLKQYQLNPSTLKFAAALFLLTLIIHGLVDVPYFKNDLAILFWFVISIFLYDFLERV